MDGNQQTILMDVAALYALWQSSQKDPTTHSRAHIEQYKIELNNGAVLEPIVIQNYGFDDDGMYVRTLDGRHRLMAHYELGRATIRVLRTDIAVQAKDAFGL